MTGPFVSPNWHVALIHFPICLLIAAAVTATANVFCRRASLRRFARWLFLIGALSAVPVVLSGVYALDDVVFRSQPQGHVSEWPWRDLARRAILRGGVAGDAASTAEAWRMLKLHVWLEVIGTVLVVMALLVVMARRGRTTNSIFVFPAACGIGLITCGAWFSGETIYRYGTATELQSASGATQAKSPGLASEIERKAEHFLGPPLQLHTFIVGVTVAAVLLALGVWLRNGTAAVTLPEGSNQRRRRGVSIFFVASAGFAILPALAGFWALSAPDEAGSWAPAKLWAAIADHRDNPDGLLTRRLAHVLCAICIILLLFALAVSVRWTRGRIVLQRILVGLLIIALAIQFWLGILLLFDGKGVKAGQKFYLFRPAEHDGAQ